MDTPNKLTDTRLTVAKKTDGTNKDKNKTNKTNKKQNKQTNKNNNQLYTHISFIKNKR